MNTRWVINAALALLVLGAGWLVFFQPEVPNTSLHALSTLNAAEVNEIVITRAAQTPLHMAKDKAGQWHITAPYRGRADAVRVENLLALLTATSSKRFAAEDLTRFELAPPMATLRLGKQTFAFGGVHPLSNQLYVLTEGAVYLISPVYVVDVLKLPLDYASKSLIGPNEIPVGFELPGLTLSRIDGTWRQQPATPALSQDDANRYADEWRHALAHQVSQPKAFKADQVLTLRLENQSVLRFQYAPQESEWMFWREDEQRAYHLSPDVAQRLLAPQTSP